MQTFGWDLVSVRTIDTINADLAASLAKTPVIVAYEDKAASLSIDATFGPWKIVPGGSNKLLRFEMPVKSGTLNNQGTPFDLTGVVAVIELQLAFIDNVSTADVKDLTFNLNVAGKQAGDTTEGAVSLVSVNAPESLDPSAARAFGDNLVQCLLANRDKLAYVFASINTDSAGSAKWMAPKRSSYCYLQGAEDGAGYLAILSVLTDRETKDLPLEVDPAVVDAGYLICSAISISAQMFLEHVFKPLLPKVFPSADESHFFMENGKLVGVRFPLPRKRLELMGYQGWVFPSVEGLAVEVEDANVRLSMAVRTELYEIGLDGYLWSSIELKLPLRFDNSTNEIHFDSDPDPVINTEPHIEMLPVFNFQKELETIMTLGIGLVFDALSMPLIADEAAADTTDNLKLDFQLHDRAASAITWASTPEVWLQEVGLSDVLYFRQVPAVHEPPPEPLIPDKPWIHGINPNP